MSAVVLGGATWAPPSDTRPGPWPQRRAATARVVIDPQLRGVVSPATLGALRAVGFRVLVIGRAALVRGHGQRWILGCWDADDRPAWADELDAAHRYLIGRGPQTERQRRATIRWLEHRRRQRLRTPDGRDAGPLPWWAQVDDAGVLLPDSPRPWRVS